MKIIYTLLLIVISHFTYGQVNCFIYPEGSNERKACELSYKAIEYSQGSRESQMIFDESIAISPKFDWSYYEKSVPYFKRGFLHEGIQILNKAIDLKPEQYLWYRAYWFWQYRNYKLCIDDLERYYKLPRAFKYQTTPGGEKDMRIILGLAYAKIGNLKKGAETIENCIKSYESESDIGFTDYHTLGILYLKNKDYQKAVDTLKKQLRILEFAESYYFLGLAHKKLNKLADAKNHLKKALELFEGDNRYKVPNAGYRVYKYDVEEEIKSL